MIKLMFAMSLLTLSFQLQSLEFTIGVNQRDVYRLKDEKGMWEGMDIELIKAVFRRTPHTFKIVDMPWPRVLKSIESGTVDITLAASLLPERQAYALFSKQTFRDSSYMLFVLKSKLGLFQSIKTLDDIAEQNVLIGALRGAIYSDSYSALLKKEAFVQRIAYIDNDQSMPTFALKGRVDAYIDSEIEGKYYLMKQPIYNKYIVPFFRITTDKERKSLLMFSKKTVSQTLVKEFDAALKELHDSGEYEQISKKYNLI